MAGIFGDGQRGGIFGAKIDPRLQAELERRAAIKRAFDEQAANLHPSQIPPREMPQSFDETLTGTIGDMAYGAPVIGPAALGLGARIGAAGQALQGKQGYSQALEDIQTKQEQFRRLNPEIAGSAQAGGSSLLAPAFGSSMGAQVVGNAALGGLDAMARGGDPSLAAVAGGGVAGALHLPAIFGGVMARTANLEALSLAKKMTHEGVPRERIWQETGWFKAPDKEWKFEISDEASRIGGPAMADLVTRGETKRPTAGVLHHKDLYEAYPELREIGVNARHAADYPGSSGYYREGGSAPALRVAGVELRNAPEIGIAVKELAGSEGPRSVMLHELQHPVQRIEGFGQGGSPAAYAHGPMFDEKARSLQGALSQELTGGLSHSPKDIIQDIKFVDPVRAEEIAREHGFTSIWEALKFLKQQDEMRTPMGQYRRLAGEVEARNVQDRRNMTAEERRATPPWKTQDVPDEQQIVRFRGLGDQLQESRAKVPAAGRTVSSRHNQPPKAGPVNPLSGRARDLKIFSPYSKLGQDIPVTETAPIYVPGSGPKLIEKTFDPMTLKPGDRIVGFVGDRSHTGEDLGGIRIGDKETIFKKPVQSEGGAGYMSHEFNPQDAVWASNVGPTTTQANRLSAHLQNAKGDVYGATMAMAAPGIDFSVQATKTALETVRAQTLTKDAREALYDAIDEAMAAPIGNGKDFPAIPDWPGVRKFIKDGRHLESIPGKWRAKLMKRLDSDPLKRLGAPNMAAVRYAVTAPEQRNASVLESGHGWFRMGDEAKRLSPEEVIRGHKTYPFVTASPGGEYAGTQPMPVELIFPGLARKVHRMTASGQQRTASMQDVYEVVTPRQLERFQRWLESEKGKQLGVAGAVAAGLLTAAQADALFGEDQTDRPKA